MPQEMVGKRLEVIAFIIDTAVKSTIKLTTKEERLKKIRQLTEATRIELTDFTFDRSEANEQDS